MKCPETTSPEAFREGLMSQLKPMLDNTRSTLRKQLLGRLHHAEGRSLEGHKPSSIQEQVMNTVFAEYLGACQRTNTLSVFLAEASLCDGVHMTHEDILASLRIHPSSQLYRRIMCALSENKENGNLPRCFAQALLQSVSSASLCTTAEVGTTTDEDLAGQAATQLALLDHRFDSGGAARNAPHIVSQKLADLQSQCDQRVALQVAAKVDVIREIELGQAREEEAARWRHDMAQQRGELDRLYSERLKHVRELEDAAALRACELQRAAERTSFDMRQRMVAEDDRMRSALQDRERDISAREAAIEARESALTAREKQCVEAQEDCRRRFSQAIEDTHAAKDVARKEVEAELDKQRTDLRLQRTTFEQERARIMALHDESSNAVARLAEKESRIEALLVSRGDAETRANVKASELHLLQSHSRRIQHELELLHQELFGGSGARSLENSSMGAVPSLPQVVGGSAEWLVRLRHEVHKVALSARSAEARANELQEGLDRSQAELSSVKAAAAAAQAEVGALWDNVRGAQALLRDAEGNLERVHGQADDYRLALKHAHSELRALEDSLAAAKAARDEAIATACVSTMRGSPRASPCADTQGIRQTVSQIYPSADYALAPESSYGAGGLSMGSSVALISQRLELLEMEETELQEEYTTFRRKLSQQQQQQAALQHSVSAGAGNYLNHHCPAAPALSCKPKGAMADFDPYRSVDSGQDTIPVHSGFAAGQLTSLYQPQSATPTALAHSNDSLQAIPAVHAMPRQGSARIVPQVPAPQTQVPAFGEHKESVRTTTTAPCPEHNASVPHVSQSPEAQSAATSLGSAACASMASAGCRSITVDHPDAGSIGGPQQQEPDAVTPPAACTPAECEPSSALPLDEAQVPSSRAVSRSSTVYTESDPASVAEDASSVHAAPGVGVPEDTVSPDAVVASQQGTNDPPEHESDTDQGSCASAADVPVPEGSGGEGSGSPGDGALEDVHHTRDPPCEEVDELEQQSEESIRLQVVGGTLDQGDADNAMCVDESVPEISDVESSYSFDGDDDDIELEGLNLGAQLLEEV